MTSPQLEPIICKYAVVCWVKKEKDECYQNRNGCEEFRYVEEQPEQFRAVPAVNTDGNLEDTLIEGLEII